MTTCFSGGFAELVFRGADAGLGPAAGDRCGLFASTWDQEASGCDPDPDRGAQEGYGLHFFHALRGQDRHGAALPSGTIDLDGDGQITLLEAHTRVRIASEAADVPTTTSERWLRQVSQLIGAEAEVPLPEEDAVIATLGQRLELVGREGEAAALLTGMERAIGDTQLDLDDAEAREATAFQDVAAEMLARWPVVDDPWHPDFGATLEQHRADITAWLDQSPEYRRLQEAMESVDRVARFQHGLRLRAAPLERLTRAVETRALARRLKARGGEDWATYEKLLACERSAP